MKKLVALCIPDNHPSFLKGYALSLINIICDFYEWNRKTGEKYDLKVLNYSGWGIDTMRERLAEEALALEAEYLMWTDTDMLFPSMLLGNMLLMLEKNPEYEAITGIYNWKKPPYMPHVYHAYNPKERNFDCAGGFPTESAFPVAGAGFGCVMIKVSVFKRVPKPWFEFKLPDHGEDLYFFRKAQPIKMLCHPKLQCDHLTQQGINMVTYLEYNGLERDKNGVIKITDEQLKRISDEQKKLVQF